MHTWKTHLEAAVSRLIGSFGDQRLPDIERMLRDTLEAEGVHFHRPDGTRLPRDTRLADLAETEFLVDIRVRGHAQERTPSPAATTGEASPSRFRAGEAPLVAPDASAAVRRDAFIREFARLEEHHEFMWAGYIVRELLPRFGFAPQETKLVLDRFCADGILQMTKVPNPKNPKFPATGVALNRSNDTVRAALNNSTSPDDSAHTDPSARDEHA